MIYGLASLLATAIFLILTAIPFFFLGWIAPKIFRFEAARWIAPPVAVLGVGCWAYLSYQALGAECNVRPLIQTYASLGVRPEGFELRGVREHSGFAWWEAVNTGTVGFVDVEGRRYCKQPGRQGYWSNCPHVKDKQSSFYVNVLPPQRIHWWSPPLNFRTIEVRESGSDKLLVRSQDALLGGGITGAFLRLGYGDQDYNYLSCGYASRDIGPYRPSLSGRKRGPQYSVVDLRMIIEAFPSN